MERTGESSARRLTSTVPVLAGVVMAVVGVVLLVIGWWGISGESVVALQLPYLASSTIPGAALLIAGAVLVSGSRRRLTDDRVDALYALLTEPLGAPPGQGSTEGASAGGLVTVEGGTRSHRAGCALIAGKVTTPVTDPAGLAPCPVCQPVP